MYPLTFQLVRSQRVYEGKLPTVDLHCVE